MFENPRRGRQAKNFTTNVPKILDLKSSSEQIFFRKLSLGAPVSHTNPYIFGMLRNNADARRCSHFELGLPVFTLVRSGSILASSPV